MATSVAAAPKAGPIAQAPSSKLGGSGAEALNRNEKGQDVRRQNIVAAKAIADAIRTSLGPRGMDKMILDSKNSVVITNDGATILKEMSVHHPAARMLVELANAQDVEAGDGTTSVVVVAGTLLDASSRLLDRGVHPQLIAESFYMAAVKSHEILQEMSTPVDLADRDNLVQAATTSLCSKVVSQNAGLLAPIAVDAVLRVIDPTMDSSVDLSDVRVVKKLGGTVEDTELVEGLVFTQQKVSRVAGGPRQIENAKIGLIQFCLSPPKTDIENNITIKDYQAMDRLLREERLHTANMLKRIAKTGCNVLLIQKSILRDAVTDLALDFAAKLGILVIRDIERDDIEFISKTLKCDPIASLDHFTADRLGTAGLVIDEAVAGGGRLARITGVPGKSTVTVLCRASNAMMLEETERSLHDALCVVRSLVKTRALLPGGGAPEMQLSVRLHQWARTLSGVCALGVRAFAEALEVVPYTLSENAGLHPIETVTALRNEHVKGNSSFGIDVKKGAVSDMLTNKVIQPLLVTDSMIKLATETVMAILKIDDVVLTR